MKRISLFLTAAMMVAVVSAATQNVSAGVKKLTPEERKARQERILRATGGVIVKPGSRQGKVAFINVQKRVKGDLLGDVVGMIAKSTRFNVALESSDAQVTLSNVAEVLEKSGATLAVFLVDDQTSPTLLVAPEDHWAIVNVAKLSADQPKESFVVARVRKEMVRAYVQLCGGASSQYPGTILSAIKKPSDLDEYADAKLPMDAIGRTVKYLPDLGVTREIRAEYCDACAQGWAPAPTNEYQKAIWEDYHKKPTKGLEIKYDPKKGK